MTSAQKLIPAITAVTDSQGNQIPHGGTTKDTSVSVMGKSGPNQKISLYKNGMLVFSIMVDASGNWAGRLTGLVVGAQAIMAVSDGHESPVWPFTVVAPK